MVFADLNIGDRFRLVNQTYEYEKLGENRAYSYNLKTAGTIKPEIFVELVGATAPPTK